MKDTAWRVDLGIGALATGAYYLLPYDPAGAVLNVVVGASAAAAIAVGLRYHRPLRRLPWGLIAAAQCLFVAGDALFSFNDLVLGIEPSRRSGWSSCWCRWPTRSETCSCSPRRPGWPPPRGGARPPSGC